jgi:type IV pilus assembly protein PilM
VIDLKKEIKLGDIFKRSPKSEGTSSAMVSKPAKKRSAQRSKPRDLVGLKLGASQLAAAYVENNGSPHLKRLARQPLPGGIVVDGEVRDVSALAAALNEFFTANNLPRTAVRMGIGTSHVGVRTFEIAGIEDESQLSNAVLFRAHDVVSIPVDEAIIDYRVLSETVDESGTLSRKILVVAAYREPVERYAAAFREAGIQLVGVDLEAFALLRALGEPRPEGIEPEAAVVAVSVGHERTILAVSDGRICEFTRVLTWGGSNLAQAVSRDVPLPLPEAEEFVQHLSFEQMPPSELLDDPRFEPARDAARREVQVLARELVASLEFYQSQPGSLPLDDILIAGGTSRIPGFVHELERLTRVQVRRADPLVRVAVDGSVESRDDLANLAIAIGLGVED